MIRILSYSPESSLAPIEIEELKRLIASNFANDIIAWVDLSEPTEEEETTILESIFHFHPLAIEDCRREKLTPERGDHLPKVEDYGSYLFSVINPIETDESGTPTASGRDIRTHQLNVFLGESYIVTHHYEQSHSINTGMTSCERNENLLKRGPDYLYHLILDDIVDQYTPMLDGFDQEIDRLEDEVFRRPNQRTLLRILGMKRKVFSLRRITMYQREMVYRLSRGEFELINQDEIAYYRNVFDHMVRAAELAESYRDAMTSLLDAYLSMTSNRMNEIMKVLTMFSTFFLPLTFIAGLYGMNFDPNASPYNMPELRWFYGYPFALVLMLVIGIAMYIYFRKKKWM
jgi:magnesium transporter